MTAAVRRPCTSHAGTVGRAPREASASNVAARGAAPALLTREASRSHPLSTARDGSEQIQSVPFSPARGSLFRPRTLSTRRRAAWRCFLALLLIPVGFGGMSNLAGAPTTHRSSLPAAVPRITTESASGFPTSIRHVITVLLENENSTFVVQNAPFEKYLTAKYGFASSYYSVCHPSNPNYLAITSGSSWECGSDNYTVYPVSNIADLVQGAGLTWGAYMESMPKPCDTGNTALYAVRHNPFVSYSDIVDNASRCNSHVLNFTAWDSAVTNDAVPNYAFITPNILDDGHNTNVSYADSWLKGWLSPLLNDSFARSTVFFIVYDESAGDNTGYDGLVGGKVYFAAVGPAVRANSTISINTSHYNLLTTTEWLLGLGNLGRNDSGTSFPPMTSLFQPPAVGQYVLDGEVSARGTDLPIAGANVTIVGGPSSDTGPSGEYLLWLSNGTYNFTVSATGFLPAAASVTIGGASVMENFSLVRPEYPVTGRVVDRLDDAPLRGATVTVPEESTATTDASGEYALSSTGGSYTIVASAPGFQSISVPIFVTAGTNNANFALSPQFPREYSLTGTVTNASNGAPVWGATVNLNFTMQVITGATGSFQFEVPNGTYELLSVMRGYQDRSALVTIRGAPVGTNLVITPAQRFDLAGVVSSERTNLPLAGATAVLDPADGVTTGSPGAFSFLVPNGTYNLHISAVGYISVNVSVSIDTSSPIAGLRISLFPQATVVGTAPPSPIGPMSTLLVGMELLGGIAIALALFWSISRSRSSPATKAE
jgi:hypothetical protein